MEYNIDDFIVKTGTEIGDSKITYALHTKDERVFAFLFWTPGDVQIRGKVGKWGILDIKMPCANPINNPKPAPPPTQIIEIIIQKIKQGEY